MNGYESRRWTLFVYGTLMLGEGNHILLRGIRPLREALTRRGFRLVDLGSFPAMVAGGRGTVHGELYQVDDLTLAAIDRLEGHPSFYERKEITIDDGTKAFTYLLPSSRIKGRKSIPSGSWRTHKQEKQQCVSL